MRYILTTLFLALVLVAAAIPPGDATRAAGNPAKISVIFTGSSMNNASPCG